MNCAAPTSDKDKEPPSCNRRHPWIRLGSVLEVGLYGLVTHTGTSSLTGLKPYHHFFLTTLIHRKRNTFSGLKLSHMRLLLAFTSPLAGWGGRVGGVGWKGREREGDRGAYQISSIYLNPRLRYNYFRFGRTNSHHIWIPPCRFWPGRSNLRAILNQVAKFRPNRTTYGGVMTSYTIWKWRPRQLHTISGLYFMMSL